MATRVLTAHVPTDLAEEVDAAARRMDRPRAWVVKEALSDWLALEAERHRMTLEAIAEGDAGDLVDHERVVAWAESLHTAKPLPMPVP